MEFWYFKVPKASTLYTTKNKFSIEGSNMIMFDRLSSTKHCANAEILARYILQPHHIFLHDYAAHDLGRSQVL